MFMFNYISPEFSSEQESTKAEQRAEVCRIGRMWPIATVISGRVDLRSNDSWIIAILYCFSKQVHYLVFVAENGIRLNQDFRHYTPDRAWIYDESIVGITSNVLKLAISKEHYDRIYWNVGILRQTLPNSLNMPGILHDRIVKAMLFPAISQNLSPISLMFVAENPTTVIFHFKNDNTRFCGDSYIDLRVFTIWFLYVKVMKYGFWVNACFQ